jgi:hypothetical protein
MRKHDANEPSGPSGHPGRPRRVRIRGDAGLSVIEAIFAFSVLSVLIAVFAPAALRKQIYTNETIAVTGLRAIVNSCAAFYGSQKPHHYPTRLAELGPPDENLLDQNLAAGTKGGYVFSFVAPENDDGTAGCAAEAHPMLYRRQGVRSFFLDASGRLLADDTGGAPGRLGMQEWESEGP